MRIRMAMALAALAALDSTAHAGGFWVPDQGAAAVGMAGAFAAKADDVTAIHYNPAGIASLSGLQAYGGLTMIFGRPQTNLNGITTDAELITAALPQFYLSYGLPYDFAVGIGVFSNFGLKIEWPGDWQGRFTNVNVNLTTITINPTIAWRPVRWLSIGVGLDIIPSFAVIERNINLISTEGALRFHGNEVGLGGNLGVLFEGPILNHRELPLFSLGVTYRSRYNLDFDDAALNVRAPPELSLSLHDSKATTTVPIPDVVTAGVGLRPLDMLFLQLEFDWVRWSRFQTLQLTAINNPQLDQTIPQNWKDGYTLRFGGEVHTGIVRLRAGFGYDWSVAPVNTLSPTIPDAGRFIVSGGIGLELPLNLVIEASVLGVIFRDRTSTLPEFPAQYKEYAVLPVVSLSYRSPQAKNHNHNGSSTNGSSSQ
jgi:long-chain fatty acid transport protein